MYKKEVAINGKKYCNLKRNKKKSGFHNLVIASDKNPALSRTRDIKKNSYKNFSIKDNLTKLRSHNLVIAPDLRSGVFPGHLGSNSLLMMNFPASASEEVNHV